MYRHGRLTTFRHQPGMPFDLTVSHLVGTPGPNPGVSEEHNAVTPFLVWAQGTEKDEGLR